MSAPRITELTLSDGKEAGQQVQTDEVYVTPGYFEALQVPVLMGRSFTERDGPDAQQVAIVNQTFVRKFFHGANPVGRYVDKNTMIVGVVEDVAIAPGLDAAAPLTGEETMYIPAAQEEASHSRCFTSGSSQVGLSAQPARWKG